MSDLNNPSPVKSTQKPKLVGAFLKRRRETLGLSQRALGQKFEPAVTTQFISNVERGVTPLPPAHIPTLCEALRLDEKELMNILEQEYSAKLMGRMGIAEDSSVGILQVQKEDMTWMKDLYERFSNEKKARGDGFQFEQALRSIMELIFKSHR